MQCLFGVCYDPCTSGCGESANCEVKNHTINCKCPQGFSGNPRDKCFPFPNQNINMTRDNQKPKDYKEISTTENPTTIVFTEITTQRAENVTLSFDIKTDEPKFNLTTSSSKPTTESDIFDSTFRSIDIDTTTRKYQDTTQSSSEESSTEFFEVTTKSSQSSTKKQIEVDSTTVKIQEDTTGFDEKFSTLNPTTLKTIDTTKSSSTKVTTSDYGTTHPIFDEDTTKIDEKITTEKSKVVNTTTTKSRESTQSNYVSTLR